jgi:hypothetical protein
MAATRRRWSGRGGCLVLPEAAGPTAKLQADDELFFLRMMKPFTRYQPAVDVRNGRPTSRRRRRLGLTGREPPRSAEHLPNSSERRQPCFPVSRWLPNRPEGFAAAIRQVLADFGSAASVGSFDSILSYAVYVHGATAHCRLRRFADWEIGYLVVELQRYFAGRPWASSRWVTIGADHDHGRRTHPPGHAACGLDPESAAYPSPRRRHGRWRRPGFAARP